MNIRLISQFSRFSFLLRFLSFLTIAYFRLKGCKIEKAQTLILSFRFFSFFFILLFLFVCLIACVVCFSFIFNLWFSYLAGSVCFRICRYSVFHDYSGRLHLFSVVLVCFAFCPGIIFFLGWKSLLLFLLRQKGDKGWKTVGSLVSGWRSPNFSFFKYQNGSKCLRWFYWHERKTMIDIGKFCKHYKNMEHIRKRQNN